MDCKAHLDYLLEKDQDFINYWHGLNQVQKNEFLITLKNIESFGKGFTNKTIDQNHYKVFRDTKKSLLHIPNFDIYLSRIPSNWKYLIRNETEKKQLYFDSLTILSKFLTAKKLGRSTYLYGGIKSDMSLSKKIGINYHPTNGYNLLDIWDVVRFRIVSEDLHVLLKVGISLWEEYTDKIIKCRNYYFIPKRSNPNYHYRGVHFELEILPNKIIEIQLITKYRDIVSHLDHSIKFKREINFFNDDHEVWLDNLLKLTNIYEFSQSNFKKIRPLIKTIRNTGFAAIRKYPTSNKI